MQGIRQRSRRSTGNCPVARLNQKMACLHFSTKRSIRRMDKKGRRDTLPANLGSENPAIQSEKGNFVGPDNDGHSALLRSHSLQSDEGVVVDFPTSPTPITESVSVGEDQMDYDLPPLLGRQISASESSEDDLDMKLIQNRLDTYQNWPVSFLSPSAMASAGFYFTGNGSLARCAFCGGVLGEWSPGDQPAREHKRYFPLCIMSRNPVSSNVSASSPPEMIGEDVCGLYYTLRNSATFRAISQPHFPSMMAYENRLGSYVGWPEDKQQRPEDLALAGLFYTGPEDAVQCFQCGGRLARWEPSDDPWTEHARWSPTCPNVISSKGQRFVDSVLEHFGSSTGSASSGVEDMSFSSSQGSTASESSPSDEDEMEESLVYRALQRNCNHATILRALQERRQNYSFARFRNIEDLIEAVSKIEECERKQKDLMKQFNVEQTQQLGSQTLAADDLLKENERLRQERRCKVCLDKDAQIIFEPCRHLACCPSCALVLDACPVCRSHVSEKKRIFFS